MDLVLESPIWIALLGAVLVGLAVLVASQLGDRRALYAAVVLAITTLAAVGLAVAIETDREQITRLIHEVAIALKANDHPRVKACLHPNADPAIKQRLDQELNRYTFHDARATGIEKIVVNEKTRPPTAIAEFFATVEVSAEKSPLPGAKFKPLVYLKVYWMKDETKGWLVKDYEYSDARSGLTRER